MGKAKRTLSVIMAALMLVFTCMTYVPTFAAENTASAPEVVFVGVDHSPLVVGDTETFSLTTANADKVQYNVVLNDAAGKLVEDLTKGYSAETAGNVPFEVKAATVFAAGKYSLVVNAKRVSDGKLATPYTAALNCVSKDDANRVYANGAMVTDKDSYVIGDKITVTGINGLAGIPGPYKYRLHVYNATTNTWTKNVVANYGDKIEWTPSAPGTYVLDVHVNTEKSTTWAKYLANPTSTDVYGTYEAWKLKTVVVSDTLKVTDVKATNKKTVKVTFNKDLGTVAPANFNIAEKDDQYSVVPVEKVSVSNNVATLTVADELADGTSYVLTSTNVPSKDAKLTLASSTNEFKYVEVTTPASIAFKTTKVAVDEEVGLVIKDKDGNDITANFDLTNDITVDTDNDNVVYDESDGTIKGAFIGHTIVNVSINDTEVETGNTIINVVDTTSVLTSIGASDVYDKSVATDEIDFENPSLVIYNETDPQYVLDFEALDQNGDEIVNDTFAADNDDTNADYKSFRSLNTDVLIVDATTGELTPVKAGTATVYEKAVFNGKTVTKTVSVEVKAKRVPTSLKLDKTSVKLVSDSTIDQEATVNVLDQYGNKMALTTGTWTLSGTNEAKVQTVSGKVSGKDYVITLTPMDDATVYGSTVVNIKYVSGDYTLKSTLSVSVVKPGEFAGYAAVAEDTTLDLIKAVPTGYEVSVDDLAQGPATTDVKVYEKDVNGNYIAPVTTNVTLEPALDKYVTTENGLTVKAVKVGSEVVTVKVGNSTAGKITFKVVDSTPVATTFSQIKGAMSVEAGTADIFATIFTADGKAFSAKDQYGRSIKIILDDVTVYSSDKYVVAVNSDGTIEVKGAAGDTAQLTIVADKVYTLTINVKAAEAAK